MLGIENGKAQVTATDSFKEKAIKLVILDEVNRKYIGALSQRYLLSV